MSKFKITPQLWDKIHHFASFPPTGVSLQQMVSYQARTTRLTIPRYSLASARA
jgi:pyruvate dehydrogenase kinase 2/3/4